MSPDLLLVGIGPAVLVGGLVWRLSARLTSMDHKLDRLEHENRELRAELRALERLLRLFIDRGGTAQ